MSTQIINQHVRDQDKKIAMLALNDALEGVMGIYAGRTESATSGATTSLFGFLCELPRMAQWQRVAPVIVPMVQHMIAQVHIAGKLAGTLQTQQVTILAGRLYDQSTNILIAAYIEMVGQEMAHQFAADLFKERGVI